LGGVPHCTAHPLRRAYWPAYQLDHRVAAAGKCEVCPLYLPHLANPHKDIPNKNPKIATLAAYLERRMRKSLFKIREYGKYGFMDATGEVVIEPQYYAVEDFYNGFSRVQLNDRLVPLDEMGRLLMRRFFNYVGLFEEHMAKVRLVQHWGFIDERGRVAIPMQFNDVSDFSEGAAAVKFNGHYGYIDQWGNYVIEPRFAWAGEFNEGLAPATSGKHSG